MYSGETHVRVRYSETDKMGYSYYGNYAQYYEVGRTDLMRNAGMTYRSLEDQGIIMPVKSMNINYMKPALYDELLRIKTMIKELPGVRVRFYYEVYNEKDELINTGDTTLVFVNEKTRRPMPAPEDFMKTITPYFE